MEQNRDKEFIQRGDTSNSTSCCKAEVRKHEQKNETILKEEAVPDSRKQGGVMHGTSCLETCSWLWAALRPQPAALQLRVTANEGNQMSDRWIR